MARRFSLFLLLVILRNFSAYSQCISTFPSAETFEVSDGGWVPAGSNPDWAWGSPSKLRITAAGNGNKCWISGGLSKLNYNGGEKAWIQSPCYDFTSLQHPYVSFLIFWDTERRYDGGNLQYSINGGSTWINVGGASSMSNCYFQNWYNESSLYNLGGIASPVEGWSGTTLPSNGSCNGGGGIGQWVPASGCIANLAGQPAVLFRFTFCSGTQCNTFDGIAFDDFTISEAPPLDVFINWQCKGAGEVSFSAASSGCPENYSWNFGDPFSNNDSATGPVTSYTYASGGNYTVTLTAFNSCSAPAVITAQVGFPEVMATVTPVTCKSGNDGTALLSLSGISNPQLTWNSVAVTNDTLLTGLTAGLYEVTASGSNVCMLDTSVEINYGPGAFPRADLGPDRFICPGERIKLQPGLFSSYLWQDSSTADNYITTGDGLFTVAVVNYAGCKDSDAVHIGISCEDKVWIPEAFSPNDDGVNDRFDIKAGSFIYYGISIYDRWEKVVFESNDPMVEWDGKQDGKDLPQGIYAYKFHYTLPDLKDSLRIGKLDLVR